MKPQTFSCLVRKATTDLTEVVSQQEKIKNILWERMKFAANALKNKTCSVSLIVEELESTLNKVNDLENIFLNEKS